MGKEPEGEEDRVKRMRKYIYLLIGATLIAGGYELMDSTFTFYVAGVLFVTAGIGEILLGE